MFIANYKSLQKMSIRERMILEVGRSVEIAYALCNLLDEFGYRPVNKYLPPRTSSVPLAPSGPPQDIETAGSTAIEKLFLWVDRTLSS